MALYEYVCESCQTATERRMPMNDMVTQIECPSCGKVARKSFANFALVGVGKGGDFDMGPDDWEDEGGMGMPPGMGGMDDGHGHDFGGMGGMDDFDF